MQQDTSVGAQRPVVVLTTTVDACEGLFVEQHAKTVLAGHLLHDRHQQHVMIDSEVGFLEDGCQLKLVGSHLIVACLTGDTESQSLELQILHKGLYALRNGTKVVVIHLLVLGRVVAHQRTTRQQQVRTCGIESLVNEEILLFPTEV